MSAYDDLVEEVAKIISYRHPDYSDVEVAKFILGRVRACNAELEAALEPFALNVDAVSLSKALGHITREHLLAARAALKPAMARR